MARQHLGGAAIQRFGGGWTEDKLGLLNKYFVAYNNALKNQRFSRGIHRRFRRNRLS